MTSVASLRILLTKIRWMLYEGITSVQDLLLLLLNISPLKGNIGKEGNKKHMVYIGEFLSPRIARLAKWTKKNGDFTTTLICLKRGFYDKFSNSAIDHTILLRNKWHLQRVMRALPAPYIVHGFAPKSKYPYIAMQLVKKYYPSVPFVADYQDVLTIYYGINPSKRWLKKELPYEKKCLQYADGMVAHSLEPRAGMQLWNIREKKKRLFFPLYCDNDSFCVPKTPYTSDNIHLVYAGGIAGSHRNASHYGDTQLQWLINTLTAQKIHFHIYPSPTVAKADYEEYEQLAEQNSYFHFHQAVSQQALSAELSTYHYGVMPFFTGVSQQSDLKHRYATTLKLFNYVEAGLPILVGSGVAYQSWLVRRYNLGMVVDKAEDFKHLRMLIEKEPYTAQCQRTTEAREHLSLKEQIPRLIRLYQVLQADAAK